MRRYSFNIDLTGDNKPKKGKKRTRSSSAPSSADQFQMSSDLGRQREHLRAWPGFQRQLEQLPILSGTTEPWDDPHLAQEYLRIYRVTRQKILEAEPGFAQTATLESHCFFKPDGTKHLVTRLLSKPDQRVNEMRLSQDGQLVRLYYQNIGGPPQNIDDLFEHGLLGLEEDRSRFSTHPHYVMRFFIFMPKGELLESTFRGVCYFNAEQGDVVIEEAESF